MHHIINEAFAYALKRITISGIPYRAFIEYVEWNDIHPGTPAPAYTDHLKVGFVRESDNAEFAGYVSMPIVDTHGMFRKGQNCYDPIVLVVPPSSYEHSGKIWHLQSLVNTSEWASSIEDFMPDMKTTEPEFKTRLHAELSASAAKLSDTRSWLALPVEYAIVELFNHKILADMRKSTRHGYAGIRATTRALAAFIDAAIRYHRTIEDAFNVTLRDYEFAAEESDIQMGPLAFADKENVLILHSKIADANFGPRSPIDFMTASSSAPLRTARPKHGITIEKCRFTGDVHAPYATHRLGTVGILSDDPHRVFVSRGISRSLPLDQPDVPYVVTSVLTGADSLSLPGVRMSHELNIEDGIVVSETFARKMGAYKVNVDSVTLPANVSVSMSAIVAYTDDTLDGISSLLTREPRAMAHAASSLRGLPCIIRPGDVLATFTYEIAPETKHLYRGSIQEIVNDDGKRTCLVTQEMRSDVPADSVILAIEESMALEDTVIVKTIRVVSMSFLPLTKSDKIADGHGNKATIAAICPDDDMPIWRDAWGTVMRAHYIATPFVAKRLALGAEIEDKLALASFMDGSGEDRVPLCVDALKRWSLDEVNTLLTQCKVSYTGTVEYDGAVYEQVPVSLRAMYRIDNNACEGLTVRTGIAFDDAGVRRSENAKIGLELCTMQVRGAQAIIQEIMEESRVADQLATRVFPMFDAVSGRIPAGAEVIELTERMPRELLGGIFTYDALRDYALTGTVCDPRLETAYGVVVFDGRRVVLPPSMSLRAMQFRGSALSVTKEAARMNNIIAEIVSARAGFGSSDAVLRMMSSYTAALAESLAGKDGLIRKSLFPVFPRSINAVVAPYISMAEDVSEIAIPRRAFGRLMKDDAFASVYETWRMCLIKRDPVHDTNSLVSVRFTLWDDDAIGVPAWLIRKMYGDYDGDKVTVMFPIGAAALADMPKLLPAYTDADFRIKQLADATEQTVFADLYRTRGMSSTFDQLHPLDQTKNPDLMAKLVKGLDSFELSAEAVKAARDFHCIKHGTALTGALGLRYTFSRHAQDRAAIRRGLELYHAIAQNTLDAKAGVEIPAMDLVVAVNRGHRSSILHALGKLGLNDPVLARELCDYAQMRSSDKDAFRRAYPVLSCIQRMSDASDVYALIDADSSLGDGVWETIFASALRTRTAETERSKTA